MNYKKMPARLVLFIAIFSFMLTAGYDQREESESLSRVESITRTYSIYKPKTDYNFKSKTKSRGDTYSMSIIVFLKTCEV